jgi:cell volume regulation protein A
MVLFGFDLLHGALLGAIVGGTGATVILTITRGLRLAHSAKALIDLESILTSPVCIVIAVVVADMIVQPVAAEPTLAISEILRSFSVAITLAFVAGLMWLFVMHKLRGRPFDYMLTLAVVFLLYFFIQSVKGSGPVGVLIFGLMLANARTISRILKLKKVLTIGKTEMRKFHEEITFFIRSFFFVFMGIIIHIDPHFIVYGLTVASLLILLRFFTAKIATLGMRVSQRDLDTIRVMAARGEGAAVLAQMPLLPEYEGVIQGAHLISNVAFTVILLTVIYTSVCILVLHRPSKKPAARPPVKK